MIPNTLWNNSPLGGTKYRLYTLEIGMFCLLLCCASVNGFSALNGIVYDDFGFTKSDEWIITCYWFNNRSHVMTMIFVMSTENKYTDEYLLDYTSPYYDMKHTNRS